MHSEDDAEEQVEEEEIEENEEDEEVDQLVDEDESAEDPDDTAEEDPPGPSSRAGRIPGQTLLPAVRLENIMQADGTYFCFSRRELTECSRCNRKSCNV